MRRSAGALVRTGSVWRNPKGKSRHMRNALGLSLKHCVDFTTGRLEPNIAIVKHTHTETRTPQRTHAHTQRDTLLGPADNVQYVYAQYAGHSQHGKPNGECRSEYPVK